MDGKREINILVVSSKYPPEYAGSGLRAHRTYKRLKNKFGFRYSVLCGSVAYNKTTRYQYEGVCVYRIACKLFRNLKNTEEFERRPFIERALSIVKHSINYIAETFLTWVYLARHGSGFDLIHIFGNNCVTGAAVSYARITKRPLLLEVCNQTARFGQYEPWPVRAIFGKGLPADTALICISERIREISESDKTVKDVWTRPNPVETSRFFVDKENKAAYRKRLGLFGDKDTLLLNIGKICPLKNQGFLLEVLKGLPGEYKLVIAGPLVDFGPDKDRDAAYFNALKERIKGSNLDGRIRLITGFLENVDEYMKASDIYLLPSKIEACATPVLEALACGIPVVAHRIEGVTTEWITDGKNGYLAALDEDEFREKIMMAASLNGADLIKGAKDIKGSISTDVIDRRYAGLIRAKCKRRRLR